MTPNTMDIMPPGWGEAADTPVKGFFPQVAPLSKQAVSTSDETLSLGLYPTEPSAAVQVVCVW